MDITIPNLACKRCGWKWVPRKVDVRLCPNCNSPYWDKEKEVKAENEP